MAHTMKGHDMTNPAHYIEVVTLDSDDETEQAIRIGKAIITPCKAADQGLDFIARLRFWQTLTAFILGAAEHSVGADGRMAIVQTMRSVPSSTHVAPEGLQ